GFIDEYRHSLLLEAHRILVVTPLFVFSPAVTLLVSSVALHEIPARLPLIGVGLVILGAYLLALSSWRAVLVPLQIIAYRRSVWLAIAASVLWGITPVFEKTAILHTFPENPTAAAFGALLALAIILFPIMRRSAHHPAAQIRARWRGFGALGVIGGIAPLFGYAAFSLGLVGYVSALFKMSSVFALLWAFLFLRERDVPRRLPGAVVLIIGAILIAM
ncbi:MAG: EamA family transporter, partial [Anaerolineales bacterium]|nr:EamA family transporter [Anaerolineales bacterium]